jgi:hypothetical protein
MRLHVKIRYAPLPEESTSSSEDGGGSPAAVEYCQRAARLFLSLNDGDDSVQMKREVVVDIEPLPDDASSLQQNDSSAAASTSENQTTTRTTTTTTLYLFIITCAADGSVHRSVRKFARTLAKLKTDSANNNTGGNDKNNHCFALTLLGHARCDNSAKQMADTIYGAGWRLEKSLLQAASLLFPVSLEAVVSGADHGLPTRQQQQRCETQVELEGPEVKFDPWIMALAQSMSSSLSSSSSPPPSHSIQSVTQETR